MKPQELRLTIKMLKIRTKSEITKNGFTLIEVLVAAVILFSSLATISMIYRGSFISSEKAEKHVNISGTLPSVLASIKRVIKVQSKFSKEELIGSGNAWQVDYSWTAKLIDFSSAPEKLDVDSGDFIKPPRKYKLWQVELNLSYRGITKAYSYKELGWNNE